MMAAHVHSLTAIF